MLVSYRMFAILLPLIKDAYHFPSRDTVLNILVTFSDIEYLGKLIMGIFASFKGILACLLQGLWDIWYCLCKPQNNTMSASMIR